MDVHDLGRAPVASLVREKSPTVVHATPPQAFGDPVLSRDDISDAEDDQRDAGGGGRARRGWVEVTRCGHGWPGGCGSSRLGAEGGTGFPAFPAPDRGNTSSSVDSRDQWTQWRRYCFWLRSRETGTCFSLAHAWFAVSLLPTQQAKILVAAMQIRGETMFCYPGNKTGSRGGKTCYVGGGT